MRALSLQMCIFFLVLFGYPLKAQRINRTDTIHLVTMMDLYKVGGGTLWQKSNKNLPAEIDYITTYILRKTKDVVNIVPLKDTACYQGLLKDTLSRRNEKVIQQVCKQCNVKNILLIDIQWRFLEEGLYVSQTTMGGTRFGYGNPKALVKGVWWIIRVKYYDESSGKMLFKKGRIFADYGDIAPGERRLGFMYRRHVRKMINRFLKAGKAGFIEK